MPSYTAIAAGGDWSNNATWGGAGHPVAGDTAIINATMTGTVTIDATSACAILNCTSNGGTLAFGNFLLTVTGNVTLGGTITAGTGGLKISSTSTMVSNAITFPGVLTFSGTNTVTLSDDWVVTGLVTFTVNSTPLNTHKITCNGGLTTGGVSGSATLVIGGTGTTVSFSAGAGIACNLTFNCTDCTVSAAINSFATGTITYTAGTITTTGSTLRLGGACTLNTSTMVWDMITMPNATVTLGSDLHCSGALALNALGSPVFSGSFDIYCGTLRFGLTPSNVSLTIPVGKTLTVATALQLVADPGGAFTSTLKSGTPSSPAYLKYTGALSAQDVAFFTFTDIDASSGIPISNWGGGALTRTVNIFNTDANSLGANNTIFTHNIGYMISPQPY